MKKTLVMVLAIILLCTFCACDTQSDSTNSTEECTVPVQNDNPWGESKAGNADKSDTTTDSEKLADFDQTPSITETILYDQYDVVITATDLAYSSHAATLELTIQNNSTQKLTFAKELLAVNGLMSSDGYLSCTVDAGKKAKDSLSLDYDRLLLYGIDAIADIEIVFDIYDEDYDHVYTDPVELKTSLAETYSYKEDTYRKRISSSAAQNAYSYTIKHFSDNTAYDEHGVTVLSQALVSFDGDDRTILLEVKNNATETIYFRTNDISVNGLILYGSYCWSSDAILPGCTRIIDIVLTDILDQSWWETYGITEIGSIQMGVELRDANGDVIDDAKHIDFSVSTHQAFDTTGKLTQENSALKITYKGIFEKSSKYDDDIYLLLLAENKSSKEAVLSEKYDSLSINGFMSDCSFSDIYMMPGDQAIVIVRLYSNDLEDIDISSISDIENFEMTFEFTDRKYNELCNLKISFEATI